MGRKFIKADIASIVLASLIAAPVFAQGLAGPYLAATSANISSDFQPAARYYVKAMAADPQSEFLKQNALVSFVAIGDFGVAKNIAAAARSSGMQNVFMDMVATVAAVKSGDYEVSQDIFPKSNDQISPLLGDLMRAWISLGYGDTDGAMATFDLMDQNETIALYGKYNKALALAYTGDYPAALEILNGDGTTPLHLNIGSIIAHVQILSELGKTDEAIAVLDGAAKRGFVEPSLLDLREKLQAGQKIAFTQVDSPAYGMAEALITMAEALSRDEPNRLALFYARLAQQLQPDNVEATMIVGDVLGGLDQYELASKAYASIPATSSVYKSASIGRAEVLRKSGDVAGATEVLEQLAKTYPSDLSVLNALGDIYRGAENFEAAIPAYSAAIDLLDNPSPGFWVLYYARGISYERTDDWPKAEADFRKALELSPDQPEVLNYIGYWYLEQKTNLDEAQSMIRKAAEKMPDSGAVTDSLGWMYYRIGKYEEAVAPMEHAVELLPVDPIINDHYGDVLWMVGRKREARFQWRRALSFGPAEDEAKRIQRKLDIGLDAVLKEEAVH